MKTLTLFAALALLVGCSGTQMPDGAAIWCGDVEYTGTFTKSQTNARALGITNASLAEKMTADQAIQLAQALGCSARGG